MVLFPNGKINLGLHILNRREDGFHNIETVFYPITLKDALEIIPSAHATTGIEFSSSGLIVEGNTDDNICIKAYHLLKKYFPQLPAIKIHLHKAIPLGAGLGGGSADGAFMLQLLNTKFNLKLSVTELINYAAQLGSDCPFFIINKPCHATGRGEILEEINVDLSAYTILLINPGIHVNTSWAFSQLSDNIKSSVSAAKWIKEIIQQPISTWRDELKNDFEELVLGRFPKIKNIKTALYKEGAIYAAMSGSGSTVYGIFEKPISVKRFTDKKYFVKILS